MIGKKINQLATELAPVSTDLTIIGDPVSGVSKKITLAQLGAIFSGAVSFYNDFALFPATGDINVIYCAKDTKKLYLWSGSAYVEVFPSQALLDTYQLRSEKGNANGYASLDSSGKVPISQLPSSIMEYKGTWSAATNTPTLANGTGDTGDVYLCNAAGTVNFGAGPLTFAVGDYVVYSGTIWQRSSGAVGTVTSVAASITGDAIGITGSPVTTSGTLALAFAGTSSQYINGAGNLINFPTSLVTGTGTIYSLTKWGFTSGNIINSNLFDTGSVIYNNNATAGAFAVQFNGNTTTGLSYGLLINAGTNANDIALRVQNASSTSEYFFVYGDGKVQINNIPNATTDTDRFIVSDNGVIKYRTGAELLSDIGGASASGYVPYTGATANVDLGTHTLSAKDLVINHSSGSGVAASITKGGAGEGLTVVKSSGSGNAASITGGVTLLSELHLTTDLADAYIASASNWNDAYNLRHNAVTLGTANGLSLSTQVLSLALASGSTTGALSSTDWTTFNNKQSALTNPVTGTGTTNYLPKFTGTSTIGNSIMSESGSTISVAGSLHIRSNNVLQLFNSDNTNGFQIYNSGATGSTNANLIFLSGAVGERMRIDSSGNLGLGVTPSAWGSGYKAFEFGNSSTNVSALFSNGVNDFWSVSNAYFDGSNFKYIATGTATGYEQFNGSHKWYQAPSGTAGNAISFTQAMTLNASGNLSIGNTNDTYKLDVSGTGRFTGALTVGGSDLFLSLSTASIVFNSAANFNTQIYQTGGSLVLYTGANPSLTIASTGAATFSSSIRANAPSTIYGATNQDAIQTIFTLGGQNASAQAKELYFRLTAGGTPAWTLQTAAVGTDTNVNIFPNGNSGLSIAYAGAATFSSSVTAGGSYLSSSNAVFGVTSNSSNMYIGGGSYTPAELWLQAGTSFMNFDVNGSTRMRINSGGQLIVGDTSSPSSAFKIDSNGYINIRNGFGLVSRTSSTELWGLGDTDFNVLRSGVFGIATFTARDMFFATNNTERARITSGGEVCINTTTVNNGAFLNIGSSGSSRGDDLMTIFNPATYGIRFLSATGGGSPNTSVAHMLLGNDGTTGRSINASGTINASGADYAEYMTKAIEDNISKGDIVGVDKNGLLTNIYEDAISFVVKSTDPSYVGGDNWGQKLEGAELEKARQKVDRVAFSGQVPCNVLNSKVGDYIIPINVNGKIKGQAITDPTLEQYRISVGKVWKVMEDGRAWIAVKIG